MTKEEFEAELQELLEIKDFNETWRFTSEVIEKISVIKEKSGGWLPLCFKFPLMIDKAETPSDYLLLYALAVYIRKNGYMPLTRYSIETNPNLTQRND